MTVKSDLSVVIALSKEGAERVLDEEELHLSRDKEVGVFVHPIRLLVELTLTLQIMVQECDE